jgi:hypothetical protein
MGSFTRIKTADILPREISIPETDMRFSYIWMLIDCYMDKDGDSIVAPAVKKLDDLKYVTVDGHHRLLVADLFLGESNVYIPSHKQDLFTEEMIPGVPEFMRDDLNYTIEHLFDISDTVYHIKEGTSFSDIRQMEGFQFLRDIESAKRFYEEWKPKIKSRK